MENTMQTHALKYYIRNGKYAWPGGYPMYFMTNDGEALSFEAVKENYRQVLHATKYKENNGWRVIGVDVNWENEGLYCSHTGDKIESAYGDNDEHI
jgi:hypothetical protein